jgi:type VI secretion system FHA domain protein
VLPVGQILKVGDYTLCAQATESAEAAPGDDPWAVLEREGSATVPVRAPAAASAPAEDDPFGEWGFESTFEPRMPDDVPVPGGTQAPGELAAFFRGLGLDPASVGPLGEGELEEIGRLVRMVTLGLLELHAGASAVKEEMRAEDRTMLGDKANNPLKTGWPQETKLRYVFGGRAATIGFPSPERAVHELLVELVAHGAASASASRATLESTLKEFAPAALKSRLLDGGATLFENARAWRAYCRYYAQEGQELAHWTQRLVDRYYSEAYLRESLRIKRETPRPGS